MLAASHRLGRAAPSSVIAFAAVIAAKLLAEIGSGLRGADCADLHRQHVRMIVPVRNQKAKRLVEC